MTNPFFSDIYCSICGRVMGKTPGVVAVQDAVCADPICSIQTPSSVNDQRDALVVASVLGGVPVARVAAHTGVSRQRVYQIIDAWKKGV